MNISWGGIFYWGIMIKKLRMNINIQNTALRIYKYLGKRKVNNIHERSYIWVIDVAVVAGRPSAVLRPREGKYLPHFPSPPHHFIWKQHYPSMWSRGDSLCPLAGFDFSFLKQQGTCFARIWHNT